MANQLLEKNGSEARRREARPVTIQDVAREMGLAKSTVSKALNARFDIAPETREAVLDTARRLGFEPNANARRLSMGLCESTIGIVSTLLDLGVGTAKLTAIQCLLGDLGYAVPLFSTPTDDYGPHEVERQVGLIKSMRGQRPRAIVCAASGLLPEALAALEPYQREGGLVVTYDVETDLDCDSVVFDRGNNTYLAARHLVQLGHRAIGFTANGLHRPMGLSRFDGFFRALAGAGLEVRREWVWQTRGDETGGAQLAAKFLSLRHRPSAMCLVNDDLAVAFIAEVQRAGVRVPADVSVVGHDDLQIARYFPIGITTVSHPVEAIAQALVDLLKSRLDGSYQGASRRVTVDGELVVRDSTMPARDGGIRGPRRQLPKEQIS